MKYFHKRSILYGRYTYTSSTVFNIFLPEKMLGSTLKHFVCEIKIASRTNNCTGGLEPTGDECVIKNIDQAGASRRKHGKTILVAFGSMSGQAILPRNFGPRLFAWDKVYDGVPPVSYRLYNAFASRLSEYMDRRPNINDKLLFSRYWYIYTVIYNLL